ncbi:MAG TPA: extracellular solute-binding protein [Firmicutes bacterium]|nr:extracellular solute-binding protein [Bacillota bacterium]
MFRQKNICLLSLFFLALIVFASSLAVANEPQEKVTLTLSHAWGGTRIPLMEEQLRRFEEKYPWIEVEAELHDFNFDKVILSIVSGSPPDVVMFNRSDVPSWAREGFVMPLDPFFGEDNFDPGIFFPPEYELCIYGGQTYSLPMPVGGGGQLLYYNRDLLAAAGFDPNNPPQFWSDLELAGRKLTEFDGDKLTQVGFVPGYVSASRIPFWAALNGYLPIQDNGRKVDFTHPKVVEAMNWVADYREGILRGMINTLEPRGEPGFLIGNTAMLTNGDWFYFEAQRQAPTIDRVSQA